MFDHYNKILVAVNITIQRLDINGALGLLWWVRLLFEFIYLFLGCELNYILLF